jgi:hypothetical protein
MRQGLVLETDSHPHQSAARPSEDEDVKREEYIYKSFIGKRRKDKDEPFEITKSVKDRQRETES